MSDSGSHWTRVTFQVIRSSADSRALRLHVPFDRNGDPDGVSNMMLSGALHEARGRLPEELRTLPLRVSVTPEALAVFLDSTRAYDLLLGGLEFSLTERHADWKTAFDPASWSRVIKAGGSFVLQRFGAGFSSLALLSTLPIGKVEVDGSFFVVDDRCGMEGTRALLSSACSVFRSLGKDLVAGEVSSNESLALVQEFGFPQYLSPERLTVDAAAPRSGAPA